MDEKRNRVYETLRTGAGRGAVAIALIVVLAVGALAISTFGGRQAGPTPSAASSEGASAIASSTPPEITVEWRQIAGLKPANVTHVTNGFIGECVASGRPAVCTSADALTWSLTPDPAVIAVDGAASFNGWSTARGAAGDWVAAGTVDPGTWRSTDGIRWTAVAAPVPGLQRAHVQALGAGFVMLAETYERDEFGLDGPATRLLTSADGAVWTLQEVSPDLWFPRLAGAIGLVATQVTTGIDSSTSAVVASQDGVNWVQLELPEGISGLGSTVRLADGGFVGIGTADQETRLLSSPDGWKWQAVGGLGAPFHSLTAVGGHAWLIARVPGTSTKALWASANGTDWTRVELLDGGSMRATQVRRVGNYVGLFDGSRLTMLGAPVEGGQPVGSASPQAVASPSPAFETRTLVIGGWRWHELSLKPDGVVVRVANGYIGRCGSSMCTSPDGWSWQRPPDPAIFRADPTALFTPESYVRSPRGGYVIEAEEGIWYSTDGARWQASQAPGGSYFLGLASGPDGFALAVHTLGPSGLVCRIYVSQDGAVWTDAGSLTCMNESSRGNPDAGAGILGEVLDSSGRHLYSADGRTWVPASLPEGWSNYGSPWRLADGSLILQGSYGPVLHSVDGGSWTPLDTSWLGSGWDPVSHSLELVVVEGRIVAKDKQAVTAWESINGGATFHVLMGGVTRLQQWGDLALAETAGGVAYVGAPLATSEVPDTTPTATGLPVSTPTPAPTPQATPADGISRLEAMRIATNYVHPSKSQAASAKVGASFNGEFDRWVWSITFVLDPYSGVVVHVDFYTGEVLGTGGWIS